MNIIVISLYSIRYIRYFSPSRSESRDHRLHDLRGQDDRLARVVALLDQVLLYVGDVLQLDIEAQIAPCDGYPIGHLQYLFKVGQSFLILYLRYYLHVSSLHTQQLSHFFNVSPRFYKTYTYEVNTHFNARVNISNVFSSYYR